MTAEKTEYRKPIPTPSAETQRFWNGCKRHELWLPYCTACEQPFFFPRAFCPRCFAWEIDWRQASGRATLYTYAIQYRPQGPGFQPPYITAIVQLEEGPRMMTNIVDVEPEPDNLHCDMALEVVFEDITDEISLPKFRPASG